LSWEPEIDEIRRREALAQKMGGKANVARQHDNGRLTVRERIDALLDEDTFHETGALAGKAVYNEAGEIVEFTPSNFVMGTGRIAGRRVVVGGDDFTVRGGAGDGAVGNKAGYSEKMALELRMPIVRLVDGTGGGGSVKTLEMIGRTYVPAMATWATVIRVLATVPVVSICMGPVAGLGAVRVASSHFSAMVKGTSQLFVAGPPVVERGLGHKISKEDLGGSHIHAHGSSAVDNEVESEEEAFEMVTKFLSYLPSNVWELPPCVESKDDPNRREEELLSIIPRNRKKTYSARRVLELILDTGTFFEIAPNYAKPLVTGFARLNGRPVGVMANDPRELGGAVDVQASELMGRFVDLCDTFHLPIINFVDNPGFLIGEEAERAGTARAGSRALAAVYQATVPWICIIIRRVYGVAGGGHGNSQALNLRYAWPSGDWGSLPIEGGVQAAYRRDIEASPDPAARRKEIEDALQQYRSPLRTAEAFGIEEIIDPRDTRRLLCEWVETAYAMLPTDLGPKGRAFRP
jgi:acetyl-CoA carboxylase carboxyltransferase component